MIYWLLVTILAYLFFAIASFGDKLVLAGKPKPISYTFYMGVFGLLALLFIPFANFSLPGAAGLGWIILDAFIHILGIYTMYIALKKFEVSKVIATIGATQPIFIFILTWVFFEPKTLPVADIFAFIILVLGSLIISIDRNIETTGKYLAITLFSSLMFAFDYIFLKQVFLSTSFLNGIIWLSIFLFLLVMFLLIRKKYREEILSKPMAFDRKTDAAFLLAQVFGGMGNLFQNFAISLVPVAFLAIVNSLKGIQYVFLFLITLFISLFFPKVLKEELSKKIIFQKIISIVLIGAGLAILIL